MNPADKNAGLRPDVAQMVRNARSATQPATIVKIEILYNLETGMCRVGAPADPLLFHGILEAARETFKLMMDNVRKQAEEKRIHTPGQETPQ